MKLSVLAVFLFLVVAIPKATSYNKYGRTCRDILCIAGQEDCVMEHDTCTGYSEQCGSYPTCKRKASTTKRGCASIKCDPGHFCSIRQENCARPPCEIKPTCIAFRTPTPTRATYPGLNRQSQSSYNPYNSQPRPRTNTWSHWTGR